MGGAGTRSAALYFTEHLSASDYYKSGVGLLQGQAFEHMGLSKREVDVHVFSSLENNINPETGKRLTPQTNKTRRQRRINRKTGELEIEEVSNRRSGMDLTLIASKTLSMVLAENPGDFGDAIERVFIRAKDKAMAFAETLARVSVSGQGPWCERTTGNLLYLSVIHRESRAVDANAGDPYLHAHNYCYALTYDHEQKRMRAVSMSGVLKHSECIDAIFISELVGGLTRLGIGTERTPDGKSFEVTAVKGREIFCKRTTEILRANKKEERLIEYLTRAKIRESVRLGKTIEYSKARANIVNERGRVHLKKKGYITMEEQIQQWRAQMTPEIRASLSQESVMAGERRNWRTPAEAKEEIVFSAFKQKSVVHEFDVVRELLRATGGEIQFPEALEFARSDAFIKLDNEGHVTTEAVRRQERLMLSMAKDAQDRYKPLIADPERAIRNPRVGDAPDQAAAARFIWNSRDGVIDVSGIAGAGKTTLVKEVVPAIREAGHKVILLAPTSASEKNLHPDFPEAITLQKFLSDLDAYPEIGDHLVIFLDESSMVSVPQMAKLVNLVATRECRLVTLGDVDQHRSPERGDAIRILQESGSVRSVELTETYRAQVAYLRETVLDLKAGGLRRELGYDRLDKHGDIREVEDTFEMQAQAVQAHLEATRKGELSIMASPTHAEGRLAAEEVRRILKGEGRIEEEDHAVKRLLSIDVEGPELRDLRHYQDGRVIVFRTRVSVADRVQTRKRFGFSPGEKWQVVGRSDRGEIKLERDGVTKLFNPVTKGTWSVYDTSEMALSVGDQVRITQGFQEDNVKFRNNDIAKIAAIDDERVTLDDGRSMRRDFLHVTQGVCITSYAAECRTVKQIVALAPCSTLTAMDAKTFYVLASRATHSALFYTDCKEALKDAAMREGDRPAVWDYERSAPAAGEPRQVDLQQGKRVSRPALAPKRNVFAQLQRLMAAGAMRMRPQPQRGGYER